MKKNIITFLLLLIAMMGFITALCLEESNIGLGLGIFVVSATPIIVWFKKNET